MNKIPKRFIRIWIGNKPMPNKFQEWWNDFKKIHPDYHFITLTDKDIGSTIKIPPYLTRVITNVKWKSSVSNILRYCALYQIGGIYVDTDIMPLKSFDEILNKDNRPFLAKRSNKSFENAVIGSPANHIAFKEVLEKLPNYYDKHLNRQSSVQTGPTYISSILFGRKDINHLPMETFYPFNGFMAPKREDKIKMFSNKNNFPNNMICAHFSNHRWGGKPTDKSKWNIQFI
tara:strand:+ start:4536 stop:5225 length:690 start_codon:yes stop_codon:yes gene_type:complete